MQRIRRISVAVWMESAGAPLSGEYWHKRAEEAEDRADGMHDPDARRTMRSIAMMYNQMALRADTRQAERSIFTAIVP